ncbi:MAG TPA: hypothetical protein VK455_07435 [Thermoplasmata archaeon]|nr:hypothetical protein [Thermoplasmata archaeon]
MAGLESAGAPSGRGGIPALDSLAPDQHRILAYASAIGSEFDFDMLAAAMRVDEEVLVEQLERLVRSKTLWERPGGGRFGFVEEEFRANVYRSLTESRLRVLHRRVAEVMERMYPNPTPEVVAELGRHFFLGKVPEKSYDYNRRAARSATDAGEPVVAIHHFERALVDLATLGGEREAERASLAEELGDLYSATANYPAADRHYQEALAHVEHDQPRVRARLLLARAEVARENLDSDAAKEGALQAIRLFEMTGDPLGVARAHRLLGRLAFLRGAYRDALDESMHALETLPPGTDPRFLGRLSIDIGNAFALLGPEVQSVGIEWYERAVERLRASRDWAELARALHNLGVAVGEIRPEDGLEYLAQARDAAERAHDARYSARTLLSGVEMRIMLGQLEDADRDNEQAGRLLERLDDTLGSGQVALHRGRIAERRGQWDDADRAYSTAVDMARRNRVVSDEAEAQFDLARLRLKTRDFEGARTALRAATELNVVELVPRLASAYLELRHQLEGPGSATDTDRDEVGAGNATEGRKA